MSVEALVRGAIELQMTDLAQRVESDLIGAVSPHSRSGLAVSAIHIEKRGIDNYFIGGTDGTGKGKTGTDHLAMLDEGNGTQIIYPKGRANGGANALKFTDGSLHGRAKPYRGIHFVAKVASKYR